MPSNAAAVARDIRLVRDASLSEDALIRAFATTARRLRDDAISAGRALPQYTTTVDGREGALEETVKLTGIIQYDFTDIPRLLGFLIGATVGASPRLSGDFRDSWVFAVDGRPYTGDLKKIPPRARLTLVNLTPYSRKVEVGAMPKIRASSGIIERARQLAQREFPHYTFNKTFILLPASFGALTEFQVPYILRGHQRSFALHRSAQIAKNKGRSVLTTRADLRAGEQLTYPALEFTRRDI